MWWIAGHFRHDLPADQLDSVILGEDSRFDHLVILIDGELKRWQLGDHHLSPLVADILTILDAPRQPHTCPLPVTSRTLPAGNSPSAAGSASTTRTAAVGS